jgi:hypothetical protein
MDVDAERWAVLAQDGPALDAHLPMAVPRLIAAEPERWEGPYTQVVDPSGARSCEASAQLAVEPLKSRVWSEPRPRAQVLGLAAEQVEQSEFAVWVRQIQRAVAEAVRRAVPAASRVVRTP